jgi:hypothetical protein
MSELLSSPASIQISNIIGNVIYRIPTQNREDITCIFKGLDDSTIQIKILSVLPLCEILPLSMKFKIENGPLKSIILHEEITTIPYQYRVPNSSVISSTTIPKRIIQTWRKDISKDMEYAIRVTKELNPDFDYVFYDDSDCEIFLKKHFDSSVLCAYNMLIPTAFRADLWRYCYLYIYGGIYMDIKSILQVPLYKILEKNPDLILVKDIFPTFIYNGFIGSPPNHPLLKLTIDMVVEQILNRDKRSDPYDITGPHVFGRAYNIWNGKDEHYQDPLSCSTNTFIVISDKLSGGNIFHDEKDQIVYYKSYSTYYKKDNLQNNHYSTLWSQGIIFRNQ